MSTNMEAIASPQDLKPWVAKLVTGDEWLDGFDEQTGRLNKVMILTITKPFDGKKVDVIGITAKEALKPYGLHESFINRPMPAHKLDATTTMGMLMRAVIIPHEQDHAIVRRDPNQMEVDYADFIASVNGVKDFVHRTLVHQRHTAKFGEQIVNFLAKGVRPLIIMS